MSRPTPPKFRITEVGWLILALLLVNTLAWIPLARLISRFAAYIWSFI